ncbi:MAG: cbb3-type cytochrome c oxidase subunit I [Verrucomicrobia bacterium]|nr:cbb3-type cytochrome c oxidase subunit I [Verrucomicrobiota bacterium]
MEASLPISTAPKLAKPIGTAAKAVGVAGALAPSVSLPLRFVVTGMLSLFSGILWLVLRPDILATYHYNQYVIAVTHLFTLGWISSIVMGAMYQLVPVALETRLHSERLARWQFVLHVIGFAGMIWMFWIWNMKQVGHFGSIFGIGVILFVYNLGRTLARIPRWNVVAVGIASALFWLLMTLCAGLFMVSAKCWPQISPFYAISLMHAHAHLGGLGFFVMMLVAVSYKLVPMFALGEVQSHRRAAWSIGLLNVGLLGLFLTILFGSPWKLAFVFVVISGLAFYGVEMRAMLRARKRRHLDWGLKYFLTAISLLLPLSLLGIILCWPTLPMTRFSTQLENVYGFLALIGVVTFAILGMLYKIVPFLVWYARYSREIGRSKIPSLADLYSPRLQALGYWMFVVGLAATSVSIVSGNESAVQWSCSLLAASLVLFAMNMGKILLHLFQPKIEPLGLRPALKGNL